MVKKVVKPVRRALVVDDEVDLVDLLELTLLRMGLEVDKAHGVREACHCLDSANYDLCLTDMRMPDGEGLDILRHIQSKGMDVPVAVITAYGSTGNAVAALKAGAFDYLAKPVALEQLRTLVKSALRLDASATPDESEPLLLGQSSAIVQALELIEKLAKSQAPVHITGESGSGKERAARLIHTKSNRSAKPFVAVNCGAIPENLMESEFFGYRKGAFTGANEDREGFFQAAQSGTLFLDEVADLPLAMQVKLLRVIQERKVRKVGATSEDEVDVRIVSATHRNLAQCVESGLFRQDLFYRLNVIELRMPALREMGGDVLMIARHVLGKLAKRQALSAPQFSAEAELALQRYAFPGNVRELENVLERALALSDGAYITPGDLQLVVPATDPGQDGAIENGDKYPLQDYLDQMEKAAILEALEKTRFNRTQAARVLGVTFRSMRYRMERLGIQ